MAVADKIIALLDTLTPASVEALPLLRRRQFADLCRHWAEVAEKPRAPAPRSGVLLDLKDGHRGH